MTTSIVLFDCPHCINEFAFDYQRIAKLTYGWRVRVRCLSCGNIVQKGSSKLILQIEANIAGWRTRLLLMSI